MACGDDSDSGPAPAATIASLGLPPAAGSGSITVSIDTGKTVFDSKCSACHGPDGVGKIGLGPALASKSFLEAASDEMLLATVANGRDGTTMIPWKNALSQAEIQSVIAYVRTLAEHQPVELDESPLQGKPEHGEDLYRSICARCHGNSGAGYSENSSGTGIGRRVFLDSASDGYIRHIVKNGKSGTKMRPFEDKAATAVANLNDVEIDSIIAHLRDRAW